MEKTYEHKVIDYTNNQDIMALHDKFVVMKKEIEFSSSAKLLDINKADMGRIEHMILDLKALIVDVQADPEGDYPEFSPKRYPIEPLSPVAKIDNTMLQRVTYLIEAIDYELLSSNSTRMLHTLRAPDQKRLEDGIKKLEGQIEYAKNVKPLDLPETAPRFDDLGHGNQGVDPK